MKLKKKKFEIAAINISYKTRLKWRQRSKFIYLLLLYSDLKNSVLYWTLEVGTTVFAM
jgi:hypothetical protein